MVSEARRAPGTADLERRYVLSWNRREDEEEEEAER